MKLLRMKEIRVYILIIPILFFGCFDSNTKNDYEKIITKEIDFEYKSLEFKDGNAIVTFKVTNKSKKNYFILKSYKGDLGSFSYPKISFDDESVDVDFKPEISKKVENYIKTQKNKDPIETTSDEYEIEIIKSGEISSKIISFSCDKKIRNFTLKLYAGICKDNQLDFSGESRLFISPTSELLNQFAFQKKELKFSK